MSPHLLLFLVLGLFGLLYLAIWVASVAAGRRERVATGDEVGALGGRSGRFALGQLLAELAVEWRATADEFRWDFATTAGWTDIHLKAEMPVATRLTIQAVSE